ncbi:MAG: radical SAM protein [Thermosipho sp. (in: Bacteria)]|nr:radical SAM protein [Thermosipho sp. (in: thermotogales)]
MLYIDEIFVSVQGEGTSIGLPTVFIRLHGCNSNCIYCDTNQKDRKRRKMSVDNILEAVFRTGITNVCITGGEPLLQEEVYCLIYDLVGRGYSVSIETNGSIPISEDLYKRSYKYVMDIKCPSSLMHHKNKYANLEILQAHDEVKFVIADKEDYKFAKSILKKYPTKAQILFSPLFNKDNKQYIGKELCNWIIKDRLNNARVLLQMHKILGVS